MNRQIPTLGSVSGVFGKSYPGFFWDGIPYTLPDSCSQDDFNRYWEKGWKAGIEARPNCTEDYNEPFRTIYGFAYSKAPRNPTSFRAIAIDAIRESFEAPF